jgi:transcriptional regulator with XRE-family HTH domain
MNSPKDWIGTYSVVGSPEPKSACMILAARCKALRKQKKISQTRMALTSGVSLGSIKRFERTGMISFMSLMQIAAVLQRVDDFSRVFIADEPQPDFDKLFNAP